MKWILRIAVLLVVLVGVVFALFMFSPRPGAFVIRTLFDKDSANLQKTLAPFEPQNVATISAERYREGDPDALLDVHHPSTLKPGERLPTLVWVHGGGWLSGSRLDAATYYRVFASQGFTVIPVDYTIAPYAQYPTPVKQVNDSLAYIVKNAERLHVDPDRIFVAGDSAGAQITSQIATLVTSQDYSVKLGIKPSLTPEQLRGVILHCGFYDIKKFAGGAENAPVGFLGWGMSTMLWSYLGSRTPDEAVLVQMSAMQNATADYPDVFISGGNGDPLTDGHSRPFAEKLKSMGVDVVTLFFEPDHQPTLGHEYQFRLDMEDAQKALNLSADFIRERSK